MRAIICDLDHTLLRSDKSLSAYTLDVLRRCRQRGFGFMVATARPQRSIAAMEEQLQPDALCTLNGARILLQGKTVERAIAPESAKTILSRLLELPGPVLSVETAQGLFADRPIPAWQPQVFEGFPELPCQGSLYKILVSGLHPEQVLPCLTADCYLTVAQGELIQIMSKSATKWAGVRTMLEAFGLTAEEALYFGDDLDDLEPISRCGLGVAVANALEPVAQAAKARCLSNDQDGVAQFLEEHFL